MVIWHCYWCLVVNNGNFTLLLTPSGQEWQLADLTPQMHHGICIMGCNCQPFWILQEKVRISCYLWIIRVVNSQLALYSHARCNPPWHSNTPETPSYDNYKFQLWGLIFARCNIVVKADLGRSPGRSNPPRDLPSWSKWQFQMLTITAHISRSPGRSCTVMPDVIPLDTPTPLKHHHMTITNFNYEDSYLPGVICNIAVKADLGRSPGRSNPPEICQLI